MLIKTKANFKKGEKLSSVKSGFGCDFLPNLAFWPGSDVGVNVLVLFC